MIPKRDPKPRPAKKPAVPTRPPEPRPTKAPTPIPDTSADDEFAWFRDEERLQRELGGES